MNLPPAARRLRRFLPVAVAVVIGAGVGAGAYALTSNGSNQPTAAPVVVPAQSTSSSSTSTVSSLTQLYKADAPGVVDITVMSTTGGSSSGGFPYTQPQQQTQAEGTGFEIDTKGNILTAEHVVSGASSITVHFQNGTSAKATLVGTDKSTDTAVIHVDPSNAPPLQPLTLGDSSSALPGQSVVAIGSPFGLPESMTAGIVSATNRTITAPNKFSISGAIQTDAAINHGNSGGPLIDVATNSVIGINDQIESDTNDNSGVGFAVPINAAKSVARTLIAGGTVHHAYMGVQISNAPNDAGARVTRVYSGTPAAQAGLRTGDVVTVFAGKTIRTSDDLTAAVSSSKPGEKVTMTIRRNGTTKHLSITLGNQPASPSS